MSDEPRQLTDWDISKDIGLPDSYITDETLAEMRRLMSSGESWKATLIAKDIEHFRLVNRLQRENNALRERVMSLRLGLVDE